MPAPVWGHRLRLAALRGRRDAVRAGQDQPGPDPAPDDARRRASGSPPRSGPPGSTWRTTGTTSRRARCTCRGATAPSRWCRPTSCSDAQEPVDLSLQLRAAVLMRRHLFRLPAALLLAFIPAVLGTVAAVLYTGPATWRSAGWRGSELTRLFRGRFEVGRVTGSFLRSLELDDVVDPRHPRRSPSPRCRASRSATALPSCWPAGSCSPRPSWTIPMSASSSGRTGGSITRRSSAWARVPGGGRVAAGRVAERPHSARTGGAAAALEPAGHRAHRRDGGGGAGRGPRPAWPGDPRDARWAAPGGGASTRSTRGCRCSGSARPTARRSPSMWIRLSDPGQRSRRPAWWTSPPTPGPGATAWPSPLHRAALPQQPDHRRRRDHLAARARCSTTSPWTPPRLDLRDLHWISPDFPDLTGRCAGHRARPAPTSSPPTPCRTSISGADAGRIAGSVTALTGSAPRARRRGHGPRPDRSRSRRATALSRHPAAARHAHRPARGRRIQGRPRPRRRRACSRMPASPRGPTSRRRRRAGTWYWAGRRAPVRHPGRLAQADVDLRTVRRLAPAVELHGPRAARRASSAGRGAT